jgi:hypothetical protein
MFIANLKDSKGAMNLYHNSDTLSRKGRDPLTMDYLDNLDNRSLNKYEKNNFFFID